MGKIYIYLTALLLLFTVSSMGQHFEWARQIGGTGDEFVKPAVADDQGNIYTTGSFSGITDFDPGPNTFNLNSPQGYDIFATKLDKNGKLVWAKRFVGSKDDWAFAITLDNQKNVLITGVYGTSLDLDPGTNPGDTFNILAAPGRNMFIVKLDSNGKFVWGRQLSKNGSWYDQTNTILTDKNGNIYISGKFESTVDFDPGPDSFKLTSHGGSDAFIYKLDAQGNFKWVKRYGSPGYDGYPTLVMDSFGSIYATGTFQQTVDFNEGGAAKKLTAQNFADSYFLKLDTTGNLIWLKQYFSSGVHCMVADKFGGVYLSVHFSGTFDADPGPKSALFTSSNSSDELLVKIDSSGTYRWGKQFKSPYLFGFISMATDTEGNLYGTGNFTETIDFDPGPGTYYLSSKGEQDAFILKIDTGCNLKFAYQLGGTLEEIGYNVSIDANNTIYTVGAFEGKADFDPGRSPADTFNLTSFGAHDIFVHKIKQCHRYGAVKATACNSYVSVTGRYTWKSTGIYTDTLVTAELCDSIIVYDLTILNSNSATVNLSSCDSMVSPSGRFTWHKSGTYRDTLLNASGCDSVLTVFLKINNSTPSTISPVACDTFISPSGKYIWTKTGTYKDTIPTKKGCDSIITVKLNVPTVNVLVQVSGETLTATALGASYQWMYCDSSTILDQTGRSFTPTEDGDYAVVVTYLGCSDTSSCYTVKVTDIAEIKENSIFSIYPNPTSGKFYVNTSLPDNINTALSITDLTGREVYTQTISTRQGYIQVDVSALEQGVYNVRLIGDGKLLGTAKLVKTGNR